MPAALALTVAGRRGVQRGYTEVDRAEMYTVPWGMIEDLLRRSVAVAALLNDAEQHHGGLIGPDTLKAANQLRLELSRWPQTKGMKP